MDAGAAAAGSSAQTSGGVAREGKLPADGPSCLVSELSATVALSDYDKLDMLFAVDDSDSMAGAQRKLQAQLPHLITVLATGDINGDGTPEFAPVKDFHLGVVSADMGLPGVKGVPNCAGLGDDGLLLHTPRATPEGMSCQASYPPFLSAVAGVDRPSETASVLACTTAVGTNGCGFQHQLEAPLKALWPPEDSRVQFLPDPATGQGANGHGGKAENSLFVRSDPEQGLSVIAIVVLTDKDDCSSSDTRPFTPATGLDPSDPLAMQSLTLRCHYNQMSLYPIERYRNGFHALRPGNENLVVFAAIAGVPTDLTNADALAATDLTQTDERDKFYARVLGDSRMQEMVDSKGTPDPADDVLMHSCTGSGGAADPPIRLVKVAEGMGENGIVQSVCEDDYRPAIDAIVRIISRQLGATCLPRRLARDASGTVGCKVIWELPAPDVAPVETPTECGGIFPFLLPPSAGQPQKSETGGRICEVAQLPVIDTGATGLMPLSTTQGRQAFTDGWYYDDFSADTKTRCHGSNKQRIVFTPMAKPPPGVAVKLVCLDERPTPTDSRKNVVMDTEQPTPGSACQSLPLNGQTSSAGDSCAVMLKQPTAKWPDGIDRSMFCHPQDGTCAIACASDADCPQTWKCDKSDAALAASGNRPFCTASNCPGGSKSASAEKVGQPCLPYAIPDRGFSRDAVYLEPSTPDCGGGVCAVYHLDGDPLKGCIASISGQPLESAKHCATPADVAESVYCTCRCHAPDGYAQCACPSGFQCVDVLEQGRDDIRGGYCARKGAVTTSNSL